MVWAPFLLLIFFLAILIKSSDFFVESVARLAKYFGLSEFVIGMTVIAIGTSLPELGSSAMAAFSGNTELAIGNIVGSNLANMGLILGSSAMYVVFKTKRSLFIRDCLILLGISSLFFIFCSDGVLSSAEGVVLIGILPFYLAYLFEFDAGLSRYVYEFREYLNKAYDFANIPRPGKSSERLDKDLKKEQYDDFVGQGFDLETYNEITTRISVFKKGIIKDLAIVIIAGLGIYFSARELIPNAVEVARSLGVTENVIGATIIAVGTSLPELSVSISSAKKGFTNMLLGNVIGSNVFNMLLVGGVSAIITPIVIADLTLSVSLPIMLIMTGLLFVFVRTNWRIDRYEGVILLALYVFFLYLLITSGFGAALV